MARDGFGQAMRLASKRAQLVTTAGPKRQDDAQYAPKEQGADYAPTENEDRLPHARGSSGPPSCPRR